jgi:hypothetical protein
MINRGLPTNLFGSTIGARGGGVLRALLAGADTPRRRPDGLVAVAAGRTGPGVARRSRDVARGSATAEHARRLGERVAHGACPFDSNVADLQMRLRFTRDRDEHVLARVVVERAREITEPA